MSGGWCWVLGLWGDPSWGCWSVQVTSLCGCLDFLTTWWLNSKSKCLKRTRHKCMVFLLSWTLLCWKSHRVISVVLTGWGSHKGPPRIKEGWHESYLTWECQGDIVKRARGMGDGYYWGHLWKSATWNVPYVPFPWSRRQLQTLNWGQHLREWRAIRWTESGSLSDTSSRATHEPGLPCLDYFAREMTLFSLSLSIVEPLCYSSLS